MKQTQIVKVNNEIEIEIVTFHKRVYRARAIKNGEAIGSRHMIKPNELNETVQNLIAEVVESELDSKYNIDVEVDDQIIVEAFTYNIWIAVNYNDGEIVYTLSTVKEEDEDDDDFDKNVVERKTWKGLMNYIKRFDK